MSACFAKQLSQKGHHPDIKMYIAQAAAAAADYPLLGQRVRSGLRRLVVTRR